MAMLAAVGAHPIRLFLILWAVAAALFGMRPVMIPSPLRRAAAAIAGALGLLSLLGFATWYVVQPTYLDPIEPSVTAVAWVWLRGGEMYPSVDGPLGYGQLYGPVTYLAQAAALHVFGASVIASKAVGLAVLIAVCAALWRICRRYAAPAECLGLLGVFAVVCGWFRDFSFWNRPDPILILVSCAAILAAETERRAVAWTLMTVAFATGFDLKVTSVTWFIPMFAVFWRRHGARAAASVIAAAIALAAVPFAIHGVSAAGFVSILLLNGRHGLSWLLIKDDGKFGGILLALLLPSLRAAGTDAMMPIAATAFSIVLTAITAAKPGSGVHHLLPLVPIVAWQAVQGVRTGLPARGRSFAVWAAAGVTFAIAFASVAAASVSELRARAALDVAGQVRQFADAHDVTRLALAYGVTDAMSFAEPELVFSGGLLRYDGGTAFNAQAAGLATPPQTIAALRGCAVREWLIPRGEAPFTVPNPMKPGGALAFDTAFREAFTGSYVRSGPATRTLDLWVCRSPTTSR